jgi:GTPase SAR1 family protein
MTTANGSIDADFMDLSSTTVRTADPTFRPDFFTRTLSRATGVVLLYDVTSLQSFEHITNQAYMYVWMCKRDMGDEVGGESCECILVGNKADVLEAEPERREVDRELAEQWAQTQGIKHFELTTKVRIQVEEATRELMRSIQRAKEKTEKECRTDRKGEVKKNRKSFGDKVKQALRKTKTVI